ncbi:hypothetical protein BHM03_00040299 [Ensete ventricosum]|nr:hypothetical protein BHM03_00040299 [Ensete ventricosum]
MLRFSLRPASDALEVKFLIFSVEKITSGGRTASVRKARLLGDSPVGVFDGLGSWLIVESYRESCDAYWSYRIIGICNVGRDHQGIVVVWVFAPGFKGEPRIASGSGPLLNFCAGIGLPCRGANATRSWATHYDVDLSFHRTLWTEGWLARLPYVSVKVAAVYKVLDLVL